LSEPHPFSGGREHGAAASPLQSSGVKEKDEEGVFLEGVTQRTSSQRSASCIESKQFEPAREATGDAVPWGLFALERFPWQG